MHEPDDTVWGVGQNNCGQLGDGTNTHRSESYSCLSLPHPNEHSQEHLRTVQGLIGEPHHRSVRHPSLLANICVTQHPFPTPITLQQPIPYATHTGVKSIHVGLNSRSYLIKNDGTMWGTGCRSGNGAGIGDGTASNRNTFTQAVDASGAPITGW